MTRAIVELSIATRLPFDALADLDGQILATYVDVLRRAQQERERAERRAR